MEEEKIQEILEEADSLKLEGKHVEAIGLCEIILAENPECAEAYEEIGDNYISLRKLDKAEKALKQALKIDSQSPNAAYLMGFLYSCKRDWKNSIAFLEKADEIKPNHSEILRCLGWSYFMGGNTARGVILLERAKTLSPDDVFILTDLGVCYLNQKEIEKALPIFRRVLEIDPENEKARECLLIVEEYAQNSRKLKH